MFVGPIGNNLKIRICMKVLLTGSNGLLGQKLVKLLVNEGEQLIATSRGANRVDYLEQEFVYESLDITNQEKIESVFKKHKPEVVINSAAMTNVDQCEEEKEGCRQLNVEAVKYLVDSCERHKAFFLHLSTDFVFDGEAGPYVEADQPNPVNFYGQSKLDAEEIVKASKVDWAIVRTIIVYGITPGMSRSNIILWVKESLENGKQLQIVDDQWRGPTLAEDLAIGCLLVAKKRAKGIFHISGEDVMTPYDMAMKTCEFFDLDKTLIEKVDGSTFSQPAKRPARTGFILDKAKTELGYRPHSFEEGIAILDSQVRELAKR